MMLEIKPIELDEDQLLADLLCSAETLSEDMIKQAPKFYYYGVLLSIASRNVDIAKRNLDVVEARVDTKIRESRDDLAAGKKLTENQITARITVNSEVMEARDLHIKCKHLEKVLTAVVEALRHRKDMLIQMGLLTREEMKGELSIRSKEIQANANYEQMKKYINNF